MQDPDFMHQQPSVTEPEAAAAVENAELIAASAEEISVSDGKASEIIDEQALQATEIKAISAADTVIPSLDTLTAAKDAAAFVAQIFADPGVSDAADNEVTQPEPQETVEVVAAHGKCARYLGIEEGYPVLRVLSRLFDDAGRVAVASCDSYNPNLVRLTVTSGVMTAENPPTP